MFRAKPAADLPTDIGGYGLRLENPGFVRGTEFEHEPELQDCRLKLCRRLDEVRRLHGLRGILRHNAFIEA